MYIIYICMIYILYIIYKNMKDIESRVLIIAFTFAQTSFL